MEYFAETESLSADSSSILKESRLIEIFAYILLQVFTHKLALQKKLEVYIVGTSPPLPFIKGSLIFRNM